MRRSGRKNRTKFRFQIIGLLLEWNLLDMTAPDRPHSPKQRYRTTKAGLAVLRGAARR